MLTAIFTILCGALLGASGYASQAPGQRPDANAQEPMRLETTLVQVPVLVRDRGGRYITDLRQRDFEIYEDGVKQDIAFFGTEDEPFSVGLLIDSSGSTAEQLDNIKSAARAFVASLRPRDRVLVVGFNDTVQVLSSLTGDRDVLMSAINAISSGEFTQVYEAVYTALWEKLGDVQGRKAIVIFTDGIDTASSEITMEDTLDAVIDSEDTIVYAIRYSTRADNERKMLARLTAKSADATLADEREEVRKLDRAYRQADEYLYDLAEMSGGTVLRADQLTDLGTAFARIADELRHQYLLGYYPLDRKKSDRQRKITVRVLRPDARVRARPSYRSK